MLFAMAQIRTFCFFFIELLSLVGAYELRAQEISISALQHGLLTWSGAALGTTCQIQQAHSLVGNHWTNFQSVLVTNDLMTTAVSISSAANASVFYRVFGRPAPLVSLKYASGAPGSANTIYAYGYQAGEYVYFYYGGAYIGYGLADANGYCFTTFTTPYYDAMAIYSVTGVGQNSALNAAASFNQNATTVQLASTAGAPGSANTIYAYGYQAGEYVYFYYGGAYIGYGLAGANGYCSTTFTTPYYDTKAIYSVIGVGQTSALSAAASFNQNAATVQLASTAGAPGSANTIYAYGYQAGEYVYFYYGGAYIGYGLAGANGYCYTTITIPYYDTKAVYSVTGVGQTSALSAAASFNQNAALVTLSSTAGAPGSANTIYAYGYQAGEYVYFYYGGAYIGYGLVGANGYCYTTFITPYYDTKAIYSVTGVGQTSALSAAASFNQNAPLVTLSSTAGAPGSANTIYAYGYQAGEYVYFYYGGTYIGYGLVGANGYCYATFTTPYYDAKAIYSVTGVGQTSALSAAASFNQNAALVTLSSTAGAPGSANTIYAYGYQAGEYVYFYYGGSYIGYGLVGANGYCYMTFTTPYYDAKAIYSVTGVGQTSALNASASFNQNAALVTLSSTAGAPGSANTIYAYGYQAGEYVYFYYGGSYIGYGLVGANGYCYMTFTTPYYDAKAIYSVTGVGQTSALNAAASFNQNAALVTLSSTAGAPGSANTIYAYGYQAGEYVYFYYGGTYIGYGLAGANGYCYTNFTTPSSHPNGTYSINGLGQTSGLNASESFNQN